MREGGDLRARTLCLALTGFFLFVGWRPFVPFPRNHVDWRAGRGLAFSPRAVVYDPESLPVSAVPPSSTPGFSVELSLEAGIEPGNGVPHILTIHDGRTPPSFVVGQWKDELLVRVPTPRNRNEYREEWISGLKKGEPHVIVISSDATATTFYIDGRLSHRIQGFVLEPDAIRGQLILGNDGRGKRSWTGTLFGVAILNRALDAHEVADHHSIWTHGMPVQLTGEPGLVALYNFAGGSGQQIRDYSPSQHHLLIPARFVMLQKTVLEASWRRLSASASTIRDVVLNLFGFVPFGFFAFYAQRVKSPSGWLRAAILATLAGAAVSLVIEVGQIWLPTRDSSMLDLICNTAGTGMGVLVAVWLYRSRSQLPLTPL